MVGVQRLVGVDVQHGRGATVAGDVKRTVDVRAGQSVEVTTRVVKGNASGLKYSFESSAGRLTIAGANANTARLDTAGVSAEEINVTCVVVDAYGRKVSYGKVIRLGSRKITEAPLPARGPGVLPSAPAKRQTEVPDVANVTPAPPPPAPVLTPKPSAPPLPTVAKKPSAPVELKPSGSGGRGGHAAA